MKYVIIYQASSGEIVCVGSFSSVGTATTHMSNNPTDDYICLGIAPITTSVTRLPAEV